MRTSNPTARTKCHRLLVARLSVGLFYDLLPALVVSLLKNLEKLSFSSIGTAIAI
jgi:hypothetical protein